MTPEQAYTEALQALSAEQWDKATAYANVGLLSLTIGAAKAVLKFSERP